MTMPRHLRYSPVNWMIVEWGHNGVAFSDCGLPAKEPRSLPKKGKKVKPKALPIREAIDTYDWERWLPEVIVGIEEPDEEIAASYVRGAAVQFCKTARVLQRELVIPLQAGVTTYPVFPYEEENIIGAISARLEDDAVCFCHGVRGQVSHNVEFELDTARNQIRIYDPFRFCKEGRLLRVLVWAAPTEAACVHDVFLYENFRHPIAEGARQQYARAVHFRDRELLRSLQPPAEFEKAMLLAKSKAVVRPSSNKTQWGSGLFGR